MKFCSQCLLPETKPDLDFDGLGICSACSVYKERESIDWDSRYRDLKQLTQRYKSKATGNWDCIVPVSGGKDSTYQVVEVLKLGLKPLCVNSRTCDLTPIGRRNLDNIGRLGVDIVEFAPNPLLRAQLNRLGLEQVGDISWPEHVGIFTIPVQAAIKFGVSLIIWGENSQNEYGGPATASESPFLTRRWLEEFGGLLGLRVSDLSGLVGLTEADLKMYTYPSDDELEKVAVTGLFLGHYIPWDGYENALIAGANGFEFFPRTVEGSLVNYENVDNFQTGIHDYFKYLKFGFGRATDIASSHIRRGRISRIDAQNLVLKLEGKFPHVYLGKPLAQILEPLGITVAEFTDICDEFTNIALFEVDSSGNLLKSKDGSLTPKFTVGG